MSGTPQSAPEPIDHDDTPNRAEIVLDRVTTLGKKVLVFSSVTLALAVFTLVVWFTFGTMWVGQIVRTTNDNTFKGFGFGLALGLILCYLALWMLRLAIMRKMPGAGRIAFSVIAGLLLSIPLFSLFMQLNPEHRFAQRINLNGPGYQAGMLVGVFIALALFVTTWIGLHNMAKKRASIKAQKTAEKAAARAEKEAEKEAERAAEAAEREAKEAERAAKKAAKAGGPDAAVPVGTVATAGDSGGDSSDGASVDSASLSEAASADAAAPEAYGADSARTAGEAPPARPQ
ncbi:hypothetical protein JT358_11955 [Micrococcales bacterium 31B]|nr:hypothetical protein [Micrococcales bacterium 31B]